ncbi:MAG: ribonucleoside-diphosphate reductase subunit alpha [Candidatus Moranbacteria bacterium]|nr:ribonucleoside-diphosphate reductase subunit alpha [Candidatus Moranbacteria bacterium]PIP25430.1 MAG: ribonucleoside-diphosphate reductase subunit alpha [Candidatus Moranbacteria bacterium CG23_combo_of_CG06-09_8_20_14_all_41_28]PIV86401.1 MAG: ribonucleoside-diphosphate reductase subunit alpha [Candidatus Moranbacteria bacterium CG17_big_fil_post_rev_8_21_14_2_50_41_107]PIW94452.1 MAG: ribonucleoside-diphosphate reductase subunit alpha [Candidatus Moranbacteria bacterium CG_4_8_14_3_um_filt
MTLTQVKRRDGEIVPFDRTRIENAIENACDAIGETEKSFITTITDEVINDIIATCGEDAEMHVPFVETIQNFVEKHLMKESRYEVAKAYILYREKQSEKREEKKEELIEQFEKNSMKVIKSNGKQELFDLKKIKVVFDRAALSYEKECHFEDLIEAFKKNIVDEIKTSDISKLLVKTCVDLVTVENIAWQNVAARILLGDLYKQAIKNRGLKQSDIYSAHAYKALFDDYIERGYYYKDFYKYYSAEDILAAGKYLSNDTDTTYEYTTIVSFTKRYLHNPNKIVRELPQEMYMSVALFLAIPEEKENRLAFAFKLYEHCSKQRISLPTPTLLNARTNYHQLSSCFKINVNDDLRDIYHAIENMAQISKFGGGIGVYLGNIRSRGSAIRGIEGMSGGVNPWVKIINDTAIAVNQLGARLGAISVTLDIWHRDIYDFLDLQTETGDIRAKAFDIFPSISIPDLFMKRLEADLDITLFDPHEVEKIYGKRLQDTFNEEFETLYVKLETDDRLKMRKVVKAKDIFKKFLKSTVETGMPYVFFRDTVNRLNPNKHEGNIYSTQLCTEICQNTSVTKFQEEILEDGKIVIRYEPGDLVVCNLASINIATVAEESVIADVFPVVMRVLDNVITLNYYPVKEAERTALRYRSVGLGYLGLAEYLAVRKLAYDSEEARAEANRLFERYTYYTYRASVDLAKERGAYNLYQGSEYSKGILLGRDVTWFEKNTPFGKDWKTLFAEMKTVGVRFGYHSAPAPNTSTAGVVGTTAALLPIYKKFFIETNLSSPTIRVAPKLSQENFWYYKEYINMNMNDVIDMMSTIYPWIDQSISFEWMIDPTKVSPAQLFNYYVKSWKQGIKTVYYVRSLSAEIKDNCVSCSG